MLLFSRVPYTSPCAKSSSWPIPTLAAAAQSHAMRPDGVHLRIGRAASLGTCLTLISKDCRLTRAGGAGAQRPQINSLHVGWKQVARAASARTALEELKPAPQLGGEPERQEG